MRPQKYSEVDVQLEIGGIDPDAAFDNGYK